MIYIVFIALGLLLVADIYFVVKKELTLSQRIWRLSARFPVIPFGFGLLMGHFFL